MSDTLHPNNQTGEDVNPSGTGSMPRILVDGSPDSSASSVSGNTSSDGDGSPSVTGSQPPATPVTPVAPTELPPTELYAAPGAVKSSMPDWAQQAVTGNIRETAQGQARRKAAHASGASAEPTYAAPQANQQAFPGYDPYGIPQPQGQPQPQPQPGAKPAHPTPRKGVTVSPGVIIAICAVIIVLVIALVVVTLSALNSPAPSAPTTNEVIEEIDHRWDGLVWQDGRAYFEENGQVVSETGIDVSEHQGWIDWNAVSNDNIDFAYIRLGNRGYTEGVIFQDQYYEYNIDGAKDAGLDVGVYFFSQAINEEEAREEAEFVLEKLDGRTLDLPIAWDHEVVADSSGRANNIDRETLTQCARAFFEVIEAAGYDTILYGNTHDLERIDLEALGNEPVWLAEYDVDKPTPKLDLTMWQYTNGATVSGVDGAVDLDIRFHKVL